VTGLATGSRVPHRKWLRRAIAVALLLAAAWVCFLRPVSARSGPEPAVIGDGWTIATPAAQGIDAAALDNTVAALLDAPLNVHAVLVERHGALVAEYYQGGKDRSVYALVSTRTSFGPGVKQDIRSIGKSVTGLLYGIALQEGKVPPVSTPVLDAYPALADLATPARRRITVNDLLNMASGLAWHEGGSGINDELRLFWKRDIAKYVLGHDVAAAPNTVFNYNGGGTAILADLIQRGTGQTLDAYARERLFAPLGIGDWEWVSDLHGRPMAFNGLRMRPRDLLKIGRLVLDQGRWQGKQVVPAAWIAASTTPVFATEVRDFRYGHQWWAGTVRWHGRSIDWHGGLGNGGQRLYVLPELDLAIVTTAGAYDEDPTAIRVNDLVQQIVDCVEP
jgi:CubicO group peptidase (beta-lactamase class C family)